MATHIAKTAASSIEAYWLRWSRKSRVQVSILTAVDRHGFDISTARWASSSPSPDYPDSPVRSGKMKKNHLNDRLSTVIDAVNDRKLPPELRGQQNNVRWSRKSPVQVSTLTTLDRHGFDISTARWASSSPSLDYPASPERSRKMKKNHLHDRLSTVIDAVNDRKLPPELCGQRNHIMFLSPPL